MVGLLAVRERIWSCIYDLDGFALKGDGGPQTHRKGWGRDDKWVIARDTGGDFV